MARVIRLRNVLQASLKHPVYAPLVLLVLGLLLAFVVFHVVEHGVAGELFACAILAAVVLRLVVLGRRFAGSSVEWSALTDRGPPAWSSSAPPAFSAPAALLSPPLRR